MNATGIYMLRTLLAVSLGRSNREIAVNRRLCLLNIARFFFSFRLFDYIEFVFFSRSIACAPLIIILLLLYQFICLMFVCPSLVCYCVSFFQK